MLRRLLLDAEFKVPEGSKAGSLQGGKLSVEFLLNDVGNDVVIKEPEGARPLSEPHRAVRAPGAAGRYAVAAGPSSAKLASKRLAAVWNLATSPYGRATSRAPSRPPTIAWAVSSAGSLPP